MTEDVIKSILDKANSALDEIRPYLKQDGGDVEAVGLTDDFVLKVEFKGSCCHCSMTDQTFKNGIEEVLRRSLPEIKAVENILPSEKKHETR